MNPSKTPSHLGELPLMWIVFLLEKITCTMNSLALVQDHVTTLQWTQWNDLSLLEKCPIHSARIECLHDHGQSYL